MSLAEPLFSARRSIINRVPSWIKSTLKLAAPVLYVSLNLFLIYFPSLFKSDGLGRLLRSPDAYGFLVALIFNTVIAVVAYSYSRIEDGLIDLGYKIKTDNVTVEVEKIFNRVDKLGEIVNEH